MLFVISLVIDFFLALAMACVHSLCRSLCMYDVLSLYRFVVIFFR